jgi:peroxiredoxin
MVKRVLGGRSRSLLLLAACLAGAGIVAAVAQGLLGWPGEGGLSLHHLGGWGRNDGEGAEHPDGWKLPERASVGYPAPGFSVRSHEGVRASLSDFEGRVVLLVFWRTTSGACLSRMPALDQLHRECEHAGYAVVTVAVSQDAKTVEGYLSSSGFAVPTFLDPKGDLAREYGVTAVPTTFVIDGQGVVRDFRVGAMSYADMVRAIKNAQGTGP